MFLGAVGVIIVVFLSVMLLHKYEVCAEQGGKACPARRLGAWRWDCAPHVVSGTRTTICDGTR
jgi:hypothetical protein